MFIYQGVCTTKYNFQETKEARPFKTENILSNQGQMPYSHPRLRSKNLHISLVKPNLSYPDSDEILETYITKTLHQVLNGQGARFTYSNIFIDNMVALFIKSKKLLPVLVKSFWNAINTGIYDNPLPVWPKFNSTRRYVSSLDLPSTVTRPTQANNFKEIVLDIQKDVSAQLQTAFSNKRYIEIASVDFFGSQLYSVMLPFWMLDVEKDGNRLTILVNGWNGKLAYVKTMV